MDSRSLTSHERRFEARNGFQQSNHIHRSILAGSENDRFNLRPLAAASNTLAELSTLQGILEKQIDGIFSVGSQFLYANGMTRNASLQIVLGLPQVLRNEG